MAQSDFVLKNIYPIFSAYIPFLFCIVYYFHKKLNKSFGVKNTK